MQETTTLACPDCDAPYEMDDNYCRRCGMYVAALRGSTALATRSLHSVERYQRQRAPLPAPVKKAMTAVAVGAAMQVGLSLASRYFAAQAAQKAASTALAPSPRRGRAVERQPVHSGLPDDIGAVAETVVVQRWWIRRP
jgi:hypothetical protein